MNAPTSPGQAGPRPHGSAARPRVLFLINSLSGGGAERVMLSLLAGSRDRLGRIPFALALLDEEPDAYTPPDWLTVHRLDTGSSLPRGFRAVRALVRRERPDLIVSFLTRANVIASLIGKLEGVTAIISERVNTSAHLSGGHNRLSRLLVRLAYPRASLVIAVSHGVAGDLADNFGVRPDRIVAIANPVDLAAIARRAQEEATPPLPAPFIAAVGRLTVTKNMMLLVRAYAEAGIAARLLILGEGPERDALAAEIDRLGLADRVMLGGFAANPYALLRHAAGYASASNGEGFPNALVEAMAVGLPLVATNCASGPSEILADRRREDVPGVLDTPYGRLVPTDDVAALADALRWLDALAPDQRAAIGARGRARVEDFSVERAVERYWTVFDEALAPRR